MANIQENIEHKQDWEDLLNSESYRPRKVVVWDYRNSDSLKTFWFSDVHLGSNSCDEDLFKRNVERVHEKQMPCADLGDLIENATRNSIGAGVYDQEQIADAQIERAVQIYKPISDLLKIMQPGNHEIRTYNDSGVNLTKIMADKLGVDFAGAGVMHYLMVGKQRYVGYSTHGGSGATTPGGKLNALLKLGQLAQTDFSIQGHVHDTLYHSRENFVLDKKDRTVKKNKQHLICNGSYLNYWGSYGQVKGYSPTNKGNAQITFFGDDDLIEVSFV